MNAEMKLVAIYAILGATLVATYHWGKFDGEAAAYAEIMSKEVK